MQETNEIQTELLSQLKKEMEDLKSEHGQVIYFHCSFKILSSIMLKSF